MMIVQQRDVKGGIAAVLEGYYGSSLEKEHQIQYVESYCDGTRLKKLKKALRCYRQVRAILSGKNANQSPDLVHIHCAFGPSFYRELPIILMAHRAGIPVVNHIHGSAIEEFYFQASNWKKRLVRSIYGMCSCLIALAPEWRERLLEIVPEKRVEVVPNYSVIPEHIRRAFAPYSESSKSDLLLKRYQRKQVLYLGRFDDLKGIGDMPEVIRLVLEQDPEVRFVLAGEGEREKVYEPLRKAGIHVAVSMPGWVRGKEKDELLTKSSLFFLPSYMEAMPVSVLDAMGYGLPIVSTNVGGIPKVVETGNGILTAPGDAHAMAKALLSYLHNSDQYEKASKRSLEIVRERFGIEQHLSKISEIYESVVTGTSTIV